MTGCGRKTWTPLLQVTSALDRPEQCCGVCLPTLAQRSSASCPVIASGKCAVRGRIGWRQVVVSERRTAKDFAEVLRYLAEDLYPEAQKLVLVTDNLNTHTLGCLYEVFPPARARVIAERLEW